MSPLDDNAMYLQLAQKAAGQNPQASAASGPPPNMQSPQEEMAEPPLPPKAIQLFVQNLPRVIPQITPQQAQTLVKVLFAAITEAERSERETPPPAPAAQPQGVM